MPSKKIIVSEEAIRRRVAELAAEISREYQGRELVMVGILNGAFIFLADLVRSMSIPVQIDFIRVASYGDSSSSSGDVRLRKDVECSLKDKHVILVEDIIDTGATLTWLGKHCRSLDAASIRVCVLIDKTERRQRDVQVEYTGFVLKSGFLVGYGLDYAQQHRQYPAIYALDPAELD